MIQSVKGMTNDEEEG